MQARGLCCYSHALGNSLVGAEWRTGAGTEHMAEIQPLKTQTASWVKRKQSGLGHGRE